MRRILLCLLVAMLIIAVGAASTKDIQVELDGTAIEFDVQPILKDGRVLVPFRKIFEELGLRVDWNNELKIASAYTVGDTLSIKLGSDFASINGEMIELDVPAGIRDGHMLVPLRFISESFQNQVNWDAAARMVRIESGEGPINSQEALPVVGSYEKLMSIWEYASKDKSNTFFKTDLGMDMPVEAPTSAETNGSSELTDYSGTNVQVGGVDEADIVKTDGEYLYHIREGSHQIAISEVDGDDIALRSTLEWDEGFDAREMYYVNDMLVVIGTTNMPYFHFADPVVMPESAMMPYGGSSLKVIIYDLEDRMNPREERTIELKGTYVASRLVGEDFYLVANQYFYPSFYTESEDLKPLIYDSNEGGGRTIGYDEIRYFPGSVENNFLITLGLDLSLPDDEVDVDVYLGSGQNIYVSHQNMYVASTSYDYRIDFEKEGTDEFFYPVYDVSTNIFKFTLDGGNISYDHKGKVPGTILNQFSMDEYMNDFRIATTTGDSWRMDEGTSKNNVFVLDENMEILGRLEGLAPTERIYAVRFMGNRAYMVTFRQVDPFYAIDLSDNKNPAVLGYLKIPGFSDYLHPYDENHIIGFGKETEETKFGITMAGMKIGLFDVTDVENPIEEDKVIIGAEGTYSELLDNHKALLFSKEKSLLAFPITVMEKDLDNWSRFAFQGVYVYSIDPLQGFELRGKITHLSSLDYSMAGDYWYNSDKNIRRIVFIDDYFYTLSDYQVQAHDIDDVSLQGMMKY